MQRWVPVWRRARRGCPRAYGRLLASIVVAGAGYIGSQMVRTHGEDGVDVTTLGNLSSARSEAVTPENWLETDQESVRQLRTVAAADIRVARHEPVNWRSEMTAGTRRHPRCSPKNGFADLPSTGRAHYPAYPAARAI